MTAETLQSVLVVDDDERYRARLCRGFSERGLQALPAATPSEALAHCKARDIDFCSLDLRMPGAQGLSLLGQLRELRPAMRIVVVTGYGSIASATEAIRLGAAHYVMKPVDVDDLLVAFAKGQTASITTPVPSLARVEWEHINRVLSDCGGNISKAARLLRIERRTLQRKLSKHPNKED